MKDLKLPIVGGENPFDKKCLSMDEYLEFILFNLRYTVDIEAVKEWKKDLAVNAAFSLFPTVSPPLLK